MILTFRSRTDPPAIFANISREMLVATLNIVQDCPVATSSATQDATALSGTASTTASAAASAIVANALSLSDPATLERWRSQALAAPARLPNWTAAARLEAVLSTAVLDEQAKSQWCRSHGVFMQDLEQWRQVATRALEQPGAVLPSAASREDRARIKELERELQRKERALAETAALLVLSKKLEAIFPRGEAE